MTWNDIRELDCDHVTQESKPVVGGGLNLEQVGNLITKDFKVYSA